MDMKYYPIVKKWSTLRPLIQEKEIQDILIRDFNKYTMGRWKTKFESGMKPEDIESCDWRLSRRGRHPEFWQYVKHGACHWVVNFCLKLAMTVEPNKSWRIVSSQLHSTVWDGEETLFDFNFLALGVEATEAWRLANQ